MGLAAAFTLVVTLSPGGGPLESKTSAVNGTASVVAASAVALGLDFDAGNPDAKRLSAEDVQALTDSGIGPWLDSQITIPNASIAEPPQAVRQFLEKHRDVIWTIVAALQKQPPEWTEKKDDDLVKAVLPNVRLQKILLAAAIGEERNGNGIDAGRAVNASWSLDRPLAKRSIVAYQILAVAMDRWRAGVLRKMKAPPLEWLGRFASGGIDDPWTRVLEAIASESALADMPEYGSLSSTDPFTELVRKAPKAVAEGLREAGPCDGSALTDQEAWTFVERELSMTTAQDAERIRQFYKESFLPGSLNLARRAARLAVDRELTLKILELRLEKEASRDGRWPEKLVNAPSIVCPDASYEYHSDGAGMEIRFLGSIADPSAGVTLPLSFQVEAPKPVPTQTPTPPKQEAGQK